MNESGVGATQPGQKVQYLYKEHEGFYPAELADRYPHIMEKIDTLWSKPDEARAYFQQLLVTQRETRQGFPMDVYMEIFALSELYNKLHPFAMNPDDDFWTWVK